MSDKPTIKLNGREYDFSPGETVLDVAARHDIYIPTLCHDPRLDPAGACRTCLVEIDGWRRLAPACATRAEAGMEIDEKELAEFEKLRTELLANKTMTDFQDVQDEVQQVQDRIHQVIAKTFEVGKVPSQDDFDFCSDGFGDCGCSN